MYPENYIYMGTFIQPIQNFFFQWLNFCLLLVRKDMDRCK